MELAFELFDDVFELAILVIIIGIVATTHVMTKIRVGNG